MSTGTLFIVATPIGNLADVTTRSLDTLKTVDMILCEDTRVTAKLLAAYEISKPLMSYHHHSDTKKIREIIGWLESGKNLALVTDAGTPGVSDPGNELIQHVIQKQEEGEPIAIIPIPGPSALTAALSICGFPTDKFLFLGFPPHKNKRQKFFGEVASASQTVVFFESSHRIGKCLAELSAVLTPPRQVCICREITKTFASTYRGTMAEILSMNITEKGEFVVIVGPA